MDVFGGCGERDSCKHGEAKHSDIKLILNKVRAAQVINAVGLKRKITSCREHQAAPQAKGLCDEQNCTRHSM